MTYRRPTGRSADDGGSSSVLTTGRQASARPSRFTGQWITDILCDGVREHAGRPEPCAELGLFPGVSHSLPPTGSLLYFVLAFPNLAKLISLSFRHVHTRASALLKGGVGSDHLQPLVYRAQACALVTELQAASA